MSFNCPVVSNEEKPSCGGTASAVEVLGTGTCEEVEIRRPLVLEQLVLTPYGPAITSLAGCILSAHEATLCDDVADSPSVKALVFMKTRSGQKK